MIKTSTSCSTQPALRFNVGVSRRSRTFDQAPADLPGSTRWSVVIGSRASTVEVPSPRKSGGLPQLLHERGHGMIEGSNASALLWLHGMVMTAVEVADEVTITVEMTSTGSASRPNLPNLIGASSRPNSTTPPGPPRGRDPIERATAAAAKPSRPSFHLMVFRADPHAMHSRRPSIRGGARSRPPRSPQTQPRTGRSA